MTSVIIDNSIDETGKTVKKVFVRKTSKLGHSIYTMAWQYYRDRKTIAVKDVINKHKKEDLKIIYSETPKQSVNKN